MLIFTIALLVVFSAITGMVLSMSAQTSESRSTIYLYNQAKLFARSSLEIAILMVENRPQSSNCLERLTINDDEKGFSSDIHFSYIGNLWHSCGSSIFDNSYGDTNGSFIADIYVTHSSSNKVIFHRKTAQKP
jgi:hypothetical protein